MAHCEVITSCPTVGAELSVRIHTHAESRVINVVAVVGRQRLLQKERIKIEKKNPGRSSAAASMKLVMSLQHRLGRDFCQRNQECSCFLLYFCFAVSCV